MGDLGSWLLILVPFVAGLQRYAVAYGYEGLDRYEARWQAARVAAIVGFICLVLALWS